MATLWQKNYRLDSLIEDFTVGRDHLLDQALVPADCVASFAHGSMLASIGILTGEELASLKEGLLTIIEEQTRGKFSIGRSDEDGHTAIENRLVELAGEAGKKIHTGRSRNDQALTATRLFGKRVVLEILTAGTELGAALLSFAQTHEGVPMPGRTHLQIAMPSSVGLWAGAWAEEILDGLKNLNNAYGLFNRSPLGAAASYGVPLPLDREMTARALGFPEVQNNVLYVNNSRGKLETLILSALDYLGITLSCMAQDLILFSLGEFGYFTLPRELCSGSSIMPQKKNPDALELMRAKSATLSSYAQQVREINRSLPSGYNRDFQETKEPFLRGLELGEAMLRVMTLTFTKLKVNPEALEGGFSPEIYATDAALEEVARGLSFRDAYRRVGLSLEGGGEKVNLDRDPRESVASRTHTGSSGNLGFEKNREVLEGLGGAILQEKAHLAASLTDLMGREVDLLAGVSC